MDGDIVALLRKYQPYSKLHGQAADEIERLRALVAIGDDLAYSLEDYAMFDDEDSRARYHIKCWKHYRKEARRD